MTAIGGAAYALAGAVVAIYFVPQLEIVPLLLTFAVSGMAIGQLTDIALHDRDHGVH